MTTVDAGLSDHERPQLMVEQNTVLGGYGTYGIECRGCDMDMMNDERSGGGINPLL